MKQAFNIVDLFCGAGGTSTGIIKAVRERMGRELNLTAVNHWKTAVNTHTLNHPFVTHLCESVENLHPLELAPDGLDLLAASCECRYHSNARGGGSCNEQSRSQAWQLIRWATDIRVDNILMENVREFMNWGPLLAKGRRWQGKYYRKGRPDPRRRGEFWRAFLATLANLGYERDWRIQRAANFGDPTSRERLMLIARKGRPVVWPEPTHGAGRARPWRTARECIDWELKGQSIFDRKRPLCENTMRRIAAGLQKFGGENARPFLVILNGTSERQISSTAKSVDEPLPTVVAGGGHLRLIEPFLQSYHGGHNSERVHSLTEPLPTQDTSNRFALVESFICQMAHGEDPKPRGRIERRTQSLDEPLRTITTQKNFALVEPLIIQTDQTGGNGGYVRSLNEPLGTVVSKQNMLLVEPLILKYYKTGRCKRVDQPLDTVTTKARFMLVECKSGREVAELDIRTRMLQPHELAAAHSFPGSYQFTGSKEDQTTQIGNSVPVELAAAHAEVVLS